MMVPIVERAAAPKRQQPVGKQRAKKQGQKQPPKPADPAAGTADAAS